jgi:hypothetical protein
MPEQAAGKRWPQEEGKEEGKEDWPAQLSQKAREKAATNYTEADMEEAVWPVRQEGFTCKKAQQGGQRGEAEQGSSHDACWQAEKRPAEQTAATG